MSMLIESIHLRLTWIQFGENACVVWTGLKMTSMYIEVLVQTGLKLQGAPAKLNYPSSNMVYEIAKRLFMVKSLKKSRP